MSLATFGYSMIASMTSITVSPKIAISVIATALLIVACVAPAAIRASDTEAPKPQVLNLAADCASKCHTDLQLAELMKKKAMSNDPNFIPNVLKEIAHDRALLPGHSAQQSSSY